MPQVKSNRRVLVIAVVVICLGLAWLVRKYEPTGQSFFPKCAFHSWTGAHCPGCGATRAVHSLLRGRLIDAVRYNPLLIVGGPIMAVLIYRQRRRERTTGIVNPRLAWTLFVVVTLYFIGRNVPSPTRSWLAPPQADTAIETRGDTDSPPPADL